MKAPVLISVVLMVLTSCVKHKACAPVERTTFAAGEVTRFESGSQHVNYVEWDFGDGNTKIGESVSHGYAQPGTCSVKLTAHSYEDRRKPDTKIMTITVN